HNKYCPDGPSRVEPDNNNTAVKELDHGVSYLSSYAPALCPSPYRRRPRRPVRPGRRPGRRTAQGSGRCLHQADQDAGGTRSLRHRRSRHRPDGRRQGGWSRGREGAALLRGGHHPGPADRHPGGPSDAAGCRHARRSPLVGPECGRRLRQGGRRTVAEGIFPAHHPRDAGRRLRARRDPAGGVSGRAVRHGAGPRRRQGARTGGRDRSVPDHPVLDHRLSDEVRAPGGLRRNRLHRGQVRYRQPRLARLPDADLLCHLHPVHRPGAGRHPAGMRHQPVQVPGLPEDRIADHPGYRQRRTGPPWSSAETGKGWLQERGGRPGDPHWLRFQSGRRLHLPHHVGTVHRPGDRYSADPDAAAHHPRDRPVHVQGHERRSGRWLRRARGYLERGA
ncbi:hypothetical protein COLO4_01745, partial [Corchorus olitorius]